MGADWLEKNGLYEIVIPANPAKDRARTARYFGHTLLTFGKRLVIQHFNVAWRREYPAKPLYRLIDVLEADDVVDVRVLWCRCPGDDATILDLPNEWVIMKSYVSFRNHLLTAYTCWHNMRKPSD